MRRLLSVALCVIVDVAVTTTTTSCVRWCDWIALGCDLEQVGKTARPYRCTSPTQKRMLRHLLWVPRFGHSQVSTNDTGTRFSMHFKRTSSFAVTERRRSHATEGSPFRVFSAFPTMARRRPWKERSATEGTWTSSILDPGEVRWDTGAQERLVGEQQMKQWSKLFAEHGLQVKWSQERPEPASGIEVRRSQSVIRFAVVEQDVPPLLPVGSDGDTSGWPRFGRQRRQSDLPSIWRRVIIAHIEKWTHGHSCRPI